MGLFNSSLDLTLFVRVTEESRISRHLIFYSGFVEASKKISDVDLVPAVVLDWPAIQILRT